MKSSLAKSSTNRLRSASRGLRTSNRSVNTTRRLLPRGSGEHGKAGQAAKNETVTVAPMEVLSRYREAQVGKARNQTLERDGAFHPCQWGTETEVDAVTEAEVPNVGTVDRERLGVGVDVGVTVRGGEVDDHLRAFGDCDVTEVDGLDRVAEGRVRNRRVEAEELFYGIRNLRRVGAQLRELLGMA